MGWRHKNGLLLTEQTAIMGIVNVTPDSFSDGGRFCETEAAVSHALLLEQQGAAILDIGGQSTRPGSQPISADTEWQRIESVVIRLAAAVRVPLSVDTFYPAVARNALETGASIVNDVSGNLNGEMMRLAAAYGAGLVVMHAGGGADDNGDGDAVAAVRYHFEMALSLAQQVGLPLDHLCLDVGIGFGKSREEDARVVACLPEILAGLPAVTVMCGASRKRVTAAYPDQLPAERLYGTLALHSLAQWNGARVLRAHDVAPSVQAAAMTDRLIRQRRRI